MLTKNMFGVLILGILLSITRGSILRIASNVTAIYSDVELKCNLSEPPLTYGRDGLTTDALIYVSGTENRFEGEAWIGFKQSYKIFKYIGCTDDLTNFTIQFKNDRNLQECFYTCPKGTTVFGLSRTKCLCYTRAPPGNSFGDSCKIPCSSPSFAACGGYNSASLFGLVPDDLYSSVSENSQTSGDCISIKARSTVITWTRCTLSLHLACHTSAKPLGTYIWRTAAGACNTVDSLLVDDTSYTGNYGDEDRDRWTGMFRTKVIRSQVDLNEDLSNGAEILFISKMGTSDVFAVTIGDVSQTTRKKYVCDVQIDEPTVTTASLRAMTSSMDNTVLYIGIGLGLAVAVIIAVVGILVCVKRRNREKSSIAESATVLNARVPVKGADYTEVDQPEQQHTSNTSKTSPGTYDYATVDKSNLSTPVQQRVPGGSDSTYDVTTTHARTRLTPGSNDYDHLGSLDTVDLYDSTSHKTADNSGATNHGFEYGGKTGSDVTYDTTTSRQNVPAIKQTDDDSCYDTTGKDMSVNSIAKQYDTYAHAHHNTSGKDEIEKFYI